MRIKQGDICDISRAVPNTWEALCTCSKVNISEHAPGSSQCGAGVKNVDLEAR